MANFNFNKVILGGRLTGDPELKQTPSGVSVCSFSVAVNRRFQSQNAEGGQPQADFINVVAWRQSAEFVSKYFRKGSSICVVGSIQTRTWTDQQGQKRYATEVVADEINFVDSKGEGPQAGFGAAPQNAYTPDNYAAPSYSTPAASSPKFEELANEDDLPF
ncbi:MAG: single-stranded DNA-binding protein [Clostridia bacterium]|nr:single-stranded DNA-binding protein [Clostridia bacterium]MBQ4574325.1 single-stranded DNA-binding protein [Clostridia bacterium]